MMNGDSDLLGLHDALSGLSEDERSQGFRAYRPYEKQTQFHAAGADHRLRMLMGGNQTGKTMCGAQEVAMHVTGEYPDWWQGRRFTAPILAMVGSEDYGTNKKGVQRQLLGRISAGEMGLSSWDEERHIWIPCAIPKDRIISVRTAGHDRDAVASAKVRHVSGGVSIIEFYTYAQGRKSLQAEKVHLVWSDEEPSEDIFSELIARTTVTRGLYMLTFTPLAGRSKVVNEFLEKDDGERMHVRIAASDAPHITKEDIATLKKLYPRHEHKARLEGHPAMGQGAVWPFDFDAMMINPFQPPAHWIVCDGIDFGMSHPTTRVRVFLDPDAAKPIWHIAQVYKASGLTVARHAAEWRHRFFGKVPVAWPKSDGTNKTLAGGGLSLSDMFIAEGVNMLEYPATLPDGSNSLEMSVHHMTQAMEEGRFFIWNNASLFKDEAMQYRRRRIVAGDGSHRSQIVSANDDVLDGARQAIMAMLSGAGLRVDTALDMSGGSLHWSNPDFEPDASRGDIVENDWNPLS